MGEMEAIIGEFISESRENLDRLDRDLVELEKNPTAKERLASVFRSIHSIKGATGFLGFSNLGAVAHAGEGVLSRLRDGVLILNPDITSCLLALVDYVRQVLTNIEQSGVEGDVDSTTLIKNLTRLQTAAPVPPAAAPAASHGGEREPAEVKNTEPTSETISGRTSPQRSPFPKTPNEEQDAPPNRKEQGRQTSGSTRIRVDVRQLDKLMNLVGELVLTRNELLQFSSLQPNAVPLGTSQRLNSITTDLQDEIMKVRLQPIESVWNKLPRLVRDLALQGNKKVQLEMRGKETELDKTLIEAITDPLMHLVRNAVDHGIEPSSARVAAGKPPEGRVVLRASHESGQVDVEVSDDGAGIDLARVKRKAVERRLVTLEQAGDMSDVQVMNLLFRPGFSTADRVTNISGRGVGMDVVKTNIERIGGEVAIESRSGLGTTVRIKIPLTLAIMPALVVTAGGNRYAIPQVGVLELARLETSEAPEKIEWIQNAPVFGLRGDLLPLIWLETELQVQGTRSYEQIREQNHSANIVFLQANGTKFGLVVDEVIDTQEIVIKPLGKQLRGISIFTGATIMGDGEVVLILDVLAMALRAHVIQQSHSEAGIEKGAVRHEPASEQQALLLFKGPDNGRMAVPLSQVTRLEKFSCAALERAGNQDVVQYRGGILPLINIHNLLLERRARPRISQPPSEDGTTIQAIVYSKESRKVGLVVEEIIDTVEYGLVDLRPASREGILATVVIQGHVTEILDLDAICFSLRAGIIEEQGVENARV